MPKERSGLPGNQPSATAQAAARKRRCHGMRRVARENALCAFMAGAGCATMAWLGLYGFAWNDYDTEARGAFDALVQGHVAEFLRLAPPPPRPPPRPAPVGP